MTATKTQEHTLSRWSLADLFPAHDSKEVKAAIKELENSAAAIEKWRDKLSNDISDKDFLALLQLMESNGRLVGRMGQFAGLFFAEDTQNQQALSFQAQMDQKMAEQRNRTLFFSLWWKSLDDETANRLMKVSGEFEYYLRQIRNFKDYTLAEPEEKIINIKDVTGASALQTLYSSLTDRYVFKVEVEGEVKELTRGELMPLIYGPNPELRAAAYQELYRVFGADGPILGQIYQSLSRDWHNENIELRKFSSPIAVRNLSNDIPDEVVDTMLGVS
jgi:oligoendopeptidase F